MIVIIQRYIEGNSTNCLTCWCSERNHPWVSEDAVNLCYKRLSAGTSQAAIPSKHIRTMLWHSYSDSTSLFVSVISFMFERETRRLQTLVIDLSVQLNKLLLTIYTHLYVLLKEAWFYPSFDSYLRKHFIYLENNTWVDGGGGW